MLDLFKDTKLLSILIPYIHIVCFQKHLLFHNFCQHGGPTPFLS